MYGEYKGDAVAALKSKDQAVRTAAMKQLASQGAWGAERLREHFKDGGAVHDVNQARILTELKSKDVGLAAMGVQAQNHFQSGLDSAFTTSNLTKEIEQADGTKTQVPISFAQLSHESLSGASDTEISTQTAASLSDAIDEAGNAAFGADKAARILDNTSLSGGINEKARDTLEQIVAPLRQQRAQAVQQQRQQQQQAQQRRDQNIEDIADALRNRKP